MAIFYSCDGCGEPVENPAKRGLVIIREYCPTCLPAVDDYLAKVDTLHDDISAQWVRRRAALQKAILKANPDWHLPDVPIGGVPARVVPPVEAEEAAPEMPPDTRTSAERRQSRKAAALEEARRVGLLPEEKSDVS
jgi:hypothetical protein